MRLSGLRVNFRPMAREQEAAFSSGESSQRKADHIRLALEQSQQSSRGVQDTRFDYEPLLGHQDFSQIDLSLEFLGKKFDAPLWVSSMTGGTRLAQEINTRLARTVARFGLGMGLGSLRPLLQGRQDLSDFHVRPLLGPERLLYGNIGIVQVDELLQNQSLGQLVEVLGELQCDGLVVHVNPLQEWYQPEGDFLRRPPLEILQEFLPQFPFPVLVKEVGQGMGPRSLKALMELPVAAIELSGFGGTNFSQMERERADCKRPSELTSVGHSASEMIDWINQWQIHPQGPRQFIVSGGVRSFLDGHYLMSRLKPPCVYGQASSLLQWATKSQQALDEYVESQIMGLRMAKSFLRVRH